MAAFLEQIQERAAARPRRVVFPEVDDERIGTAIRLLRERALVEPVDVDFTRSEEFAESYYTLRKDRGIGFDAARAAVTDPLFAAALMVRHGYADGCVAGAVRTTSDVIRAAIQCIGAAPGISSISSAFYMVVPGWPDVLTFADAGVIPDPSEQQLADIAEAAVIARKKIVGDEPRVAFLSFSTRGSAFSESTRKVRNAVARLRERLPGIVADGELQADAALVRDIAARKAPDSRIKGDANILIFPNLDAGNIGYKLVQRLAGAEAIGPILQGLAKPCNDLSRGAGPNDIVSVACITALQASTGTEQILPRRGPVAQT